MDEELENNSQDENGSQEDLNDKIKQQIAEQVANEVKQQATKVAKEGAKKAGGAALKAIASAIAPILPIILIVIAIILVIVIIYIAVTSMFTFDISGDSISSQNGITGEYFYGVRLVIQDEQEAENVIENSYYEYIVNVLDAVDDIENIDLNLTLPQEIALTTDYNQHIDNMVVNILNTSLNSSIITTENYKDFLPNVQTFGLNPSLKPQITDSIKNYIINNQSEILILNSYSGTLEDDIANVLENNSSYMYCPCEKYFVKDVILSEDEMLSISKDDYVAMIYMPKTDVTVYNISYGFFTPSQMIATLNYYNQNLTTLTVDTPNETWTDDNKVVKTMDYDDKISLKTFTSINPNNLIALRNETPLFAIVKKSNVNQDLYLSKNENNVYTYLPNDSDYLYLSFTANDEFLFIDVFTDQK